MKRTFEVCEQIAKAKGEDYTRGDQDALINFKESAKESGVDPKVVCYIFMRKHWTAIGNYVKTNGTSQSEPIEGRIHNLINYAVLMLGLIIEEEEFQKALKKHESNTAGT
jgi:hypothetical protein